MTDFSQWLNRELEIRGWSRYKLHQTSGVDSGYISRILNREQPKPGPDVLKAFAHALGYPPEVLFRKAGLLPEKGPEPPDLEELKHIYMSVSEEAKQEILNFARYKKQNS
jgi:transcriptional regulator with XRE-family HTH domain